MLNYDYILSLNDDDTILVKTNLLLYVYSYYETNNLLNENLRKKFDMIINETKISKTSLNFIEPQYFRMSMHDVKIIFAKAPMDIYTDLSFKVDESSKIKSK